MGGRSEQRKKKGKERLDKFYHLAKEQGYRARSAFKLLQLSQRFHLFQKNCRSVVDLCAAPGGWLQVAAKHCPVASTIVGIDLVPIQPIKGVETFTGDITTASCAAKLKKLVKFGDVDLVLHDGSPNMGTDWSIDAFNQNTLVLSAARLASQLLREGGIFVTKVFRSSDYTSLLYVFNTLFSRVDSTKPQASRAVSAEIFVVCQGYKKPSVLDERLFDPRYIFYCQDDKKGKEQGDDDEEGETKRSSLLSLNKEKLSRKRLSGGEGEDDGGEGGLKKQLASLKRTGGGGEDGSDESSSSEGGEEEEEEEGIFFSKGGGMKGQFAELIRKREKRYRDTDWLSNMRSVSVYEFFTSKDPTTLLLTGTRDLFFTSRKNQGEESNERQQLEENIRTHPLTTNEILDCLKDIQVLGKGDLAGLLKWRFRVKKDLLRKKQSVGQEGEKQKKWKEGQGADDDEEEDRKADSMEDDEELDQELVRFHDSVRRRESKQQKRQERKQKQLELRKRLTRGAFSDGAEGLGADPDLFSLGANTAELLQSEEKYVDADLLLTGGEDEQDPGSTLSPWNKNQGDAGDEIDGGKAKKKALRHPGGGDEIEDEEDEMEWRQLEQDEDLDDIDRMEASLTVNHRLGKLNADLGNGKRKKKITRREKVTQEWVSELQGFRDSIQDRAYQELSAKRQREEEEDDDEEEEDEEEEDDHGSDRRPKEVLDEDEEDHTTTTSSSPASNRNSKSISSTPSTSESSGRDSHSEKGEGQSSRRVQVSTERWFSQPMFSDMGTSDESMLPSMLLPSTLGEDGVDDEEDDDFNPVIGNKDNNNTQSLKKKEGKNDPDEQEDSEGEEEDGEKSSDDEDRSEVIRELDDSALPQVPLSEKQRKRKQRAALEEKKAKGSLSKKRKRTDGDDLLGGGDELEDESDRTGLRGKTRIEEVPAPPPMQFSRPTDADEIAEIQALGSLLVKKRSRMDLLDGAYNRYAFNDDALPEWFEEDEKAHTKPELPVTKELMREYRRKLLDISRRPIRKVQEARARKKLREKRRLQKVKSQTAAVAESTEFTESAKARAIEKIARKARKAEGKRDKAYVVTRRVGGGKMAQKKGGKKKGGGGGNDKVKLVDRRLKKDKRGLKAAQKRKSKKGGGSFRSKARGRR